MLLLTGAEGQVGQALARVLPAALTPARNTLDITDRDAVLRFVAENNVTTIINCAAYTAVDAAEDTPDDAWRINAAGAENLARSGACIIQLSTDYVFDGTAAAPYTETAATHPLSVYGRSKRAGEEAVLEHAAGVVVLRTSWVHSPYRANFVKTIRRLADERAELRVIADQQGTPTYAADLAAAIAALLPHLKSGVRDIVHYSNAGACSWYEFAAEIVALSQLPCKVVPIGTADYPAKAARPAYSVLDKTKFMQLTGMDVPAWQDGLQRCLKEMAAV